jgi:hypothetical protein
MKKLLALLALVSLPAFAQTPITAQANALAARVTCKKASQSISVSSPSTVMQEMAAWNDKCLQDSALAHLNQTTKLCQIAGSRVPGQYPICMAQYGYAQ